jgi:glycosyltransferase involved in cell wall biosynthesis
MCAPNESGGNLVKIVFIIDSLQPHGTQRFLTHLARGLKDLGYERTVIALNDASNAGTKQVLSSAGCAVICIGKVALLLSGLGWWRLVAMLKRLRPDVVMTMLDFADTLGRPAARLAGCRSLVTSIRARNLAKPSWQRWFDRKTVRWAEKVVFNSRSIVGYACQNEGVRQEQVAVIPNGVDDLFAQNGTLRGEYRQQLGLQPETLLLGSVARLYPQKNLSLLLRAFAKLSTDQEWKAVLIGDGPERSSLLSLGRELGLTDRLIWLGTRDDVEGWLAAMDIFVHTANFEGMPNAVMEAMAMKLPVVASAVDGTRDLIEDGVSGYLVASGNVDAFAERIRELMENPDRARRLGETAHREVLEHFGMVRMIQAYDDLFRSLAHSESV